MSLLHDVVYSVRAWWWLRGLDLRPSLGACWRYARLHRAACQRLGWTD